MLAGKSETEEICMPTKRLMTTFAAAVLLAASWLAGSEMVRAQSSDQLVEKYTPLAGSPASARTLVSGLRNGSEFTLNGVKFDTPTKKMGNGEVDIALQLAQKELNTTTPSAQQLRAALVGTADKPGILALRAEGKGWGQIAQSMGIKLGDVMRSPKAERHARVERPEKPNKPQRPEKPERPERPGR
jgi:hypothetical protein